MGKLKILIIAGGLLILAGIILKAADITGIITVLCFSLGALLKVLYLVTGLITKRIKPGKELIFLFTGLALLFSGIWLRSAPDQGIQYLHIWFISSGIAFKILFLILFIRRQKKARTISPGK